MMSYQRVKKTTTLLVILSFGMNSYANTKVDEPHKINAIAMMKGSVMDTPCSITLRNRYQTVNFSPLALPVLSNQLQREIHDQPFIIELQDCGSVYSMINAKTWKIRFLGQNAEYIDAFILHGASQGLGVSVLDNSKTILQPNRYYALSDNVLSQDKSGYSLFLRYFLRLELTGKPIRAGSYHGVIRFFIDYQ